MSTYLLRAEPQKMSEWKAAAKEQSIPFSDWLRRAADSYLSSRSNGGAPSFATQPEEGAATGRVAPSVDVTPDPKVRA